MPKIVESIPNRLRRLRAAAGLTQEGLARAADVGLRTVAGLERGDRDLKRADAGTVLALARTLGASVEELLR